MRYIDIKLSLPVVAPLLDVLKSATEALRDSLACPVTVDDLDPEMRDVWNEELIQEQNTEVKKLLGLFDENFFSTGMVRIAEDQADAIVRATAAVRLHLRKTLLASITDEMLEAGSVDIDRLKEPVRSGFLCYAFLASLQDLVLQHLEAQ